MASQIFQIVKNYIANLFKIKITIVIKISTIGSIINEVNQVLIKRKRKEN